MGDAPAIEFVAPVIQWSYLTPVIVVLGAGVLGVLVEAFVPDRVRRTVQLVLALLATGGAVLAAALLWAGVMGLWGVRLANWYGRLRADGRPG